MRVALGMAVLVVAAIVIVAAGTTGRLWVFEALAGIGLLVGLGVAAGALDRQPRHRTEVTTREAAPSLRAAVRDRLAQLDPLEHRRLDLGDPWPSIVVGPTGIAVIAPASVAHAEVARRLAAVVAQVRETLAGTTGAVLQVQGLLVFDPPQDQDVVDVTDGPVRRVPVADLLDAVTQGALAPLSAVSSAAGLLANELLTDPRPATRQR